MYPVVQPKTEYIPPEESPVRDREACIRKGEVVCKYTVQYCKEGSACNEPLKKVGMRKVYITPGTAWQTVEAALKELWRNAVIKQVKYTDDDNDEIYIVTGSELENAIYREGIIKFHVLYQHEIVYTVQKLGEHKHNETIGRRKAYPTYPSAPISVAGSRNLAFYVFTNAVQELGTYFVIKSIQYADFNGNIITIQTGEQLDDVIFINGITTFNVVYD